MGNITIGQIAITVNEAIREREAKDLYSCFIPKWSENDKGTKYISDINLNEMRWVSLMRDYFGYHRFGNGEMYVHIEDNVVRQVTRVEMYDTFMNHVEAMPTDHVLYHAQETIINKIMRSQGTWFSNDRLINLKRKTPIVFNTDTGNEAYFYFSNGFVVVTKEDMQFLPYTKMPTFVSNGEVVTKMIWKSQILSTDFEFVEKTQWEKSEWYSFLQNVAHRDMPDRLKALLLCTGYLLHGYMVKKRKAIILTDSVVSGKPEGRSGKTLYGRGIQNMLNASPEARVACEINGKDYNPANEFRWQLVGIDTRTIVLNDVRDRFRFETLFNDISDGIERQKKNETPVRMQVKFAIPTNTPIELDGGSARDRAIEFEFTNYYREGFSPENEFGHLFFTEWDTHQWLCFYNVMLYATQLYLAEGLPTAVAQINLDKRKIITFAGQDICDYMEYKLHTEDMQERIILNEMGKQEFGVDKNELYRDFLEMFPSDKMSLTLFTKRINNYVQYSDVIDSISKKRSNKKETFYFHKPAPPVSTVVEDEVPFVEDIPDFLK